ncbi:MAG: DUF47 family protein [Desulfobacterales bacterium]|nr:DUF47 family protein [Desulfobacterales bacterium]
MEFRILKRSLGIERQIDDFLNQISEAGLLFKEGMDLYLNGRLDIFEQKRTSVKEKEHKADALRRSLVEELYLRTLIPESRGDVLDLLETTDSLLDRFKGTLEQFDIERPEIRGEFHAGFRDLTSAAVKAVEAIVRSSRAFFKDINQVADHMHKVSHWETESDKIAMDLRRAIFNTEDLRLSQKMQLRDFVRHIDKISDRAEDVADRLGIFVIKRSL